MMQALLSILPYLLVTFNTCLMLGLFFGINQRVRKVRKEFGGCQESMKIETGRQLNSATQLAGRLASLEKEMLGFRSIQPGAVSMNSAVRANALKMHRMGQPSDRIAEVLRVPKGEVDLLVKVHGVVMRAYEGAVARPDQELMEKV